MQSSDNRSSGARSGAVVELRSAAQALEVKPIRKSFGRPQVVIREHTNNAVRWTPGERLNHLIEETCIRFASNDAVITGSMGKRALDEMDTVVTNLRRKVLIDGAGHWIQQERPDEVNAALIAFLREHHK